MLQTSGDRLRHLIDELTSTLAASSDGEVVTRQLKQTLALLHAAAETLDELERSVARRPKPRAVTAPLVASAPVRVGNKG